MSELADFFYYTLLKKAGIIMLALGIAVAVMFYFYFQNWGSGFEATTGGAVKFCQENADCFYWCEECVSIASVKTCEPCPECRCVCNQDTKQCELA